MQIPGYIFSFLTSYTFLITLNLIFAFSVLFLERKNPSTTLAWLMVLFLFPGVGVLLYLFFAQNISRYKISKYSNSEQKLIHSSLDLQIDSINNNNFTFTKDASDVWKDMIHLGNMANAYFSQDNAIEFFTDGTKKFESLFHDIKNAKKYINITYFIIKDDRLGRKFLELLTEKAKEGVEIRLLLDAMGCNQITRSRLVAFKNAGGKYAYFFPSKLKFINLKLNYRNHRKIVIIDGNIGYTGGFNIGLEYIDQKKKFGHWRDTHIKIEGSSVYDLNMRFTLDWRFSAKEVLELPSVFENKLYTGNTGVQIISSGPDSPRQDIKYGYLRMISSAKERIYIQTPYFVPDASIIEALKSAVLSGVDVRIMIPCMPDHIFVYWATYSYIGELLDFGAKAYIYNNGFLHAKTITVDGEIASIGSANFDIRSFKLNFETNAFIYDEEKVAEHELLFEEDMKHCIELTKELYDKRSLFIKFKESIARLLSEIL